MFVSGLVSDFSYIQDRFSEKMSFTFKEAVAATVKYSIEKGKFSKSDLQVSPQEEKVSSNSTVGHLFVICKFWRMKAGCFKGDKCPLKDTHRPETAGQGWNEAEVVKKQKGKLYLARANQGNNNTPSRNQSGLPGCFLCGRKNHTISECHHREQLAALRSSLQKKKKDLPTADPVVMTLLANFPVTCSDKDWYMDSGATEHIARSHSVDPHSLELLGDVVTLTVGNSQAVVPSAKTTVGLNSVQLKDVLVCDECPINIISEGRMLEAGCKIIKEGIVCKVYQKNVLVLEGETTQRLTKITKAYDTVSKGCTPVQLF